MDRDRAPSRAEQTMIEVRAAMQMTLNRLAWSR